ALSTGGGGVGGRPFARRTGRYLLITHADIDRAERFFTGRGIWAVPIGRCLPVVRSFVAVVAGFGEVPPVLFAFLSLIGTAIWVTAISLVGYGVGNAWTKVNHDISLAGYGIVAIAVIAIGAFVIHRLRDLRKEEHAEAGQQASAHQPKHRSPMSWAARSARPSAVPPSRAPRSTSPATPTTCAPASRSAATAVSTEAPVVDVSSTASTRRPATSGPSIRRCSPCALSDLRTTKAFKILP